MTNKKIFFEKSSKFVPKTISKNLYYFNYNKISSDLFLSQSELQSLQQNRLYRILRKANKLPYYRDLNCDPTNLKSFPVLTKKDFINKHEEFTIKNILNVKTATSGSSGEPFIFYRHINDIRKERLYVLRNFMRYGYNPGDQIGALRSFIPRGNEGTIKKTSLQNITWFSAYHSDDINFKRYVRFILDNKLKFMFSYPSSFYLFARYCLSNSIDIPDLKAVFLSSEKMLNEWHSTISLAFPNTEVIDRYGTAELSNSFTYCSKCGGYHINEDYGYTELKPIRGSEKKHEIIGTGFLNSSFPMVRYNMKDIFRLDKIIESKCEYGSKVYLGEIEGRTSDFIFADGKFLPGVNFYTLFHHFEKFIKQFQIIQESENLLIIKLVIEDKKHKSQDIEERLDYELRLRVGSNINLKYEYTDYIKRDSHSGKYKNIISNINITN